jgi:NAD(P)H-dependent nitrite reductase large subunit/NAD(P)H-dependent nitrite reductase small subunit
MASESSMVEKEEREVVVVLGNGMVGHRFLERVRRYDLAKRFELVSIGEEPIHHYNRMLLTEYFEHLDMNKLMLAGPDWYTENSIDLRTGARAVGIDADRKVVKVKVLAGDGSDKTLDEQEVHYDRLVIATGASALVPPIPGVSLRGVFAYRTVKDLNDIIAYSEAQHARELAGGDKKYALVIGGGLLGLEAAKAVHDLHIAVRIVNRGGRLMSRQLDDAGAKVLHRQIVKAFGIDVLYHKTTKQLLPGIDDDEELAGVEFVDGEVSDDVFMVVFATGIKPRDELARVSGLEVAGRGGGIIIDDYLSTTADEVYAIGECISHRCITYGLVAPGYEMADALAKNLTCASDAQRVAFIGGDVSTKLKLMGTEVGSFGAFFPEDIDEPFEELVYNNPLENIYKKLYFSADGKKLLGGILVGDTSDFPRLSLMCKTKDTKPLPGPPNEILLGKRGGDAGGSSVLDLPDEVVVCSCNGVTKGDLCSTIKSKKLTKLADVKKVCNAGTACGGCLPMVKDILEAELAAAGTEVDKSLCEHFAYSRQELYQIIMVEKYETFTQLLAKHGRRMEDPRQHGCEICKPTVASIFASLQNRHVLQGDRAALQDSNDRFLANLQKSGQFSVVPRIAGGEITPDKLIVIGEVAKEYNLYTKITGGQRVDLFGAEKHDLPAIWEKLVNAGFESGHAYGKALRTVKSCVGTTWCRFGQQDAVGFAIFLEDRYKGIRSPHKIKGGVSGCTRECAEARGKDFGCIATERGYNIFVCGNGGTNPKHAVLLASDVPQELAVKYLDRFLMYYITTADRLQRTSKWLESLEGGIDQLRRVVMEDALGICATLEEQMSFLVGTYECEWKKVIESPELRAQFAQFKNTSETQRETAMYEVRNQLLPRSPRAMPPKRKDSSTPSSPKSPMAQLEESNNREWVAMGDADAFLPNSGGAVLYSATQLAVFNVIEICNGIQKTSWFATQNMCPYDGAFVLAQGIVGDLDGRPKVVCPMHKRSYDLLDGDCLTEEGLQLETFPAKEEDGRVLVLLPPANELDERLATAKFITDGEHEHEQQHEHKHEHEAVVEDVGKLTPCSLDW